MNKSSLPFLPQHTQTTTIDKVVYLSIAAFEICKKNNETANSETDRQTEGDPGTHWV